MVTSGEWAVRRCAPCNSVKCHAPRGRAPQAATDGDVLRVRGPGEGPAVPPAAPHAAPADAPLAAPCRRPPGRPSRRGAFRGDLRARLPVRGRPRAARVGDDGGVLRRGRDAPVLAREQLAAVAPEAWASLRFQAVLSLQLLT